MEPNEPAPAAAPESYGAHIFKKQGIEKPSSSNNDYLRIDVKHAAEKMQKYLDRKIREYHWFCARLDDTEPNEEECEEISRKADEVEELGKRMVEAIEHLRILVENQTSIQ